MRQTFCVNTLQELQQIEFQGNHVIPEVIESYENNEYPFPALFLFCEERYKGHQTLMKHNGGLYPLHDYKEWGFDVEVVSKFINDYPEYLL